MSSVTAQIADAVATELTSIQAGEPPEHAFGLAFTPVRAWRPRYALKDLAELKVTVCPSAFNLQFAARARTQVEYGCEIAIQQKVEGGGDPAVDALAGLAEELAEYWIGRRLDSPDAVCVAAGLAPESVRLFVPEHLDAENLFTAVVALTFRRWEGT